MNMKITRTKKAYQLNDRLLWWCDKSQL